MLQPGDKVVMRDLTWPAIQARVAARGEAPLPRIAYLDGSLELRHPGRDQERLRSFLGRLVEDYAIEHGIDLSPYGAWLLERPDRETAAEPDECYILGTDQSKDTPDLVIEVLWTSGGLEKLEIYRRLSVPEVWFWRDGVIQVHVLDGDSFRSSPSSRCLPDLDLGLLCSFLDEPTVTQAVRAFRAALG